MKGQPNTTKRLLGNSARKPLEQDTTDTSQEQKVGGLVAIIAAAMLALVATVGLVIIYNVSWWWWLPIYSVLGVLNAVIIIGFLSWTGR